MFRRKALDPQASFLVATSDLPSTPANTFYQRLDRALAASGFGDAVRTLCAPFYESDRSRGGRPGIDPEVYEQVFGLVLKALQQSKLLRGRRLGIDASVLEANASLRSLEHRLSGEAYAEYVRKLAEAAGVDPSDPAAVRRGDKRRPGRKTSCAICGSNTWRTRTRSNLKPGISARQCRSRPPPPLSTPLPRP